jgi:fluoroquinolone resistance protein
MSTLDEASDEYLYRKTFTGVSLKGATIEGKEFDECAFRNCAFPETTFSACIFRDSSFLDCDLSIAQVTDSSFVKVAFKKCRLTGINWTNARWPTVPLHTPITFEECLLSYSVFHGVALRMAAFLDCVAHEADFSEADLSGCDFAGTDLAGATFNQTNLSAARLEKAHNYSIDLRSNKLAGAQFSFPEAASLLRGAGVIIVD